LINDLQKYNLAEYQALYNLKDGGGNSVDVYVGIVSNLIDEITGTSLSGKTDAQPDTDYGLTDSVTGEKTTVVTVKSSHGKNTASILIKSSTPDKGATLAHEGGHALFNVPNMAEYIEYQRRYPNSHGHGVGDPSREGDKKEEGIVKKNKKNN